MAENITRQNTTSETNSDPTNPVDHLDGGYEGSYVSDDYTIPSCTIEDIDKAIHRLYDKDIGFTNKQFVGPNKTQHIPKPFVIFATGERFAVAKRLKPPKDLNGKLMLPAISIRRTSIEQTSDDITGRGMNQYTGTITIKRKLSPEDREYQNLINKPGFKNLPSGQGQREDNNIINNSRQDSMLNTSSYDPNNIYEIITIPQPQFYTASYEIIFWTNYTQHMNSMIETLFASYLPQSRAHKLVTDKGYWFIAYNDEQKTSQDNFDDLQDSERLVRYTFTAKVKGYLLAPQGDTNSTPVRRHISAPQLVFDVYTSDNPIRKRSDIERVKEEAHGNNKWQLTDINAIDPSTKKPDTSMDKFVEETKTRTVQGETVYKNISSKNVKSLEEFVKTLK